MPTLTDREKRTIRLGAAVLLTYLLLFYGVRGWRHLENERAQYDRLLREAQHLKLELQPYEKRALLIQDWKGVYQMDFAKLSKVTVVAEASAALQQAATVAGVQLGPIRESAARTATRELTSVQLEGAGPVSAVLTFVQRLPRLGYPLIVDSLQITADPTKPGTIKINLTIVILDFEQWKSAEAQHA